VSTWFHQVACFFHTWYGVVVAVVGFLLALYYGPRQMFETLDWYLNRFRDEAILDVLRHVRIPKKLPPHNPLGPNETHPTVRAIAKEGSYSIGDLADILNRNHRSIGKSVKRLRAKGMIELHRGGFRLKGWQAPT
jgi:DNA-binding transcriptional ArsR family regulator